MTGAEIVAFFEQEKATVAQKEIDRFKKQIEELKRDGKADMAAAIRVPSTDDVRFKLGKRKARKATASRIYEAENALVEAITAFPDVDPEKIVRSVSRLLFLEPVVIARLWSTARARYERNHE